ncbi:TetR/AcrR family transcriptional regulator [Streptomyces sp. LE64]|uniref:TetR/AcrR family transcriptional regulator n=1 Tax=Streptomyces sp. LE64 TaxID=3448653 RepID=UPI00404247A7
MAHVTAAERRPQLIAAAIELMAREGVAAGSTRAIAAELGVAQATVHYTFGTKADLYRAVLESLSAELIDGAQRGVAAANGLEEALRATADAFWADLGDRPELHLVWFELVAFSLRTPELRDVVERHYRYMTRIATDALTETGSRTGRGYAVPAEELADFLVTGLDGVCMGYLLRGETEPSPQTRRILDQVVRATLALADARPAPAG